MEVVYPQCATCYKLFENPDELLKHFNRKTKCKAPKEKFCCEFCDKNFNNALDLKNHVFPCERDEKTSEKDEKSLESEQPKLSQILNSDIYPHVIIQRSNKSRSEKSLQNHPEFTNEMKEIKEIIKKTEHDRFNAEICYLKEVTLQKQVDQETKKVEQETMKIEAENQTLQAIELTKQMQLKLEILKLEKELA